MEQPEKCARCGFRLADDPLFEYGILNQTTSQHGSSKEEVLCLECTVNTDPSETTQK